MGDKKKGNGEKEMERFKEVWCLCVCVLGGAFSSSSGLSECVSDVISRGGGHRIVFLIVTTIALLLLLLLLLLLF